MTEFQNTDCSLSPLCQGCICKDYAIYKRITNHDCKTCKDGYWAAAREVFRKDYSQRLHDSIGFLNVMIQIAEKHKVAEIPADNLKILRELLRDIKQEIFKDE